MELYSLIIKFDSTDNIFVASIPELPGCIAHGKTQEAAIKEIRIAAEMWIEAAQEEGWDIPQPLLYESHLASSPAV